MKKLILSLAVALTTVVSAYAAEISGTITTIDPDNMIIVLEDGSEIDVSEEVSIDALEEGMQVTIMTNDDGLATEVMIAQ